MSKNEFRTFFAKCKPFIKMNYFLKRAGITSAAFSLFMRGEEHNYCLSIERLNGLYDDLVQTLEKVA